jgi:hypothetical protein
MSQRVSIKANPRRITKVPAMAQAIETRTPAIRAWTKNPLFKKGSINRAMPLTFYFLPLSVLLSPAKPDGIRFSGDV